MPSGRRRAAGPARLGVQPVGIVDLPAVLLVGRDRAVVVDVGDVIGVLVPDLAGGDPGVVGVADDVDAALEPTVATCWLPRRSPHCRRHRHRPRAEYSCPVPEIMGIWNRMVPSVPRNTLNVQLVAVDDFRSYRPR